MAERKPVNGVIPNESSASEESLTDKLLKWQEMPQPKNGIRPPAVHRAGNDKNIWFSFKHELNLSMQSSCKYIKIIIYLQQCCNKIFNYKGADFGSAYY